MPVNYIKSTAVDMGRHPFIKCTLSKFCPLTPTHPPPGTFGMSVGVVVGRHLGGRLARKVDFFSSLSSMFLGEEVLKSKNLFSAPKPRPFWPFWVPMVAILDFAGGAVMQAMW